MINTMKLFSCVFFVSFALLTKVSNCDNHATKSLASTRRDVKIAGLNAYASGYPYTKHVVILATDFLGYKAPNLRMIADKVAAAGFYAVAPDFYDGDFFVPQNPNRTIQEWIAAHSPVEAVDDAKPLIAALRKRGARTIGFAGFCWGGKLAVELAKTRDIQSTVLLHPSLTTVDDIKKVEVPISILGAELDDNLPPSVLKQYKKILASKPKIDSQVKMFAGVFHGWTLRYNVTDLKAAKVANEAHHDMIQWFIKHDK